MSSRHAVVMPWAPCPPSLASVAPGAIRNKLQVKTCRYAAANYTLLQSSYDLLTTKK